MSFREFVEESRKMILSTFQELGLSEPSTLEWSEPPDKSLGDLSFRIGFMIGRSLRKGPGQVAINVAKHATEHHLSGTKYIESIEGHPAGFLNIKLKKEAFFSDVISKCQLEEYGKINLGNGKSVLLEHTSVNPNKALHVGHLRNVALGDALARIFRFTNHDTFVLNYIDDSGLQVADVMVGLVHLGYPESAPKGEKYDHYSGDVVYVGVNKKYEEDPALKEKQKSILKAIEARQPEIISIASRVTENILREQLHTCWRFGATYDLLIYESDIIESKLWSTIFEELKSKGITRLESEGRLKGCWIVTIEGESEGEDKVLVRSDGTATYVAKDVPLAALKSGQISDVFSYSKYGVQPNGKELWRTRASGGEAKASPVPWGADRSFTVIDSRQSRLQRIILRILEQLSGSDLSDRYVHIDYSIISLSPRTASTLSKTPAEDSHGNSITMSGRKGAYINADDALDLLKEKALVETRKRNERDGRIDDHEWLEQVSEKIAISALRFSILKQDLDKMIVFDLEESLKLFGETGPYMLYTYARAYSIISKIGEVQVSRGVSVGDALKNENETELLKIISRFDIAVEKAARNLAPKWIAHYSFELCEAFNKFYETSRVVQEPDLEVRNFRIRLVLGAMNVLKSSLSLLGIEVSERI